MVWTPSFGLAALHPDTPREGTRPRGTPALPLPASPGQQIWGESPPWLVATAL